MTILAAPDRTKKSSRLSFLRENAGVILVMLVLALLPFVIAILDGQSIPSLLANEAGSSKFVQGFVIEIMILGLYALSYDLILGITGLLSFGHAMFFAVGAYLTGVMLKSFDWSLWATLGMVLLAGIVQALLFAIVLPRVKGITFALVTLGMASVFYIVIQSNELSSYTGADVGLQGVIAPDFINSVSQRLRFYFIVLIITFLIYFLYRRFVTSPTGRVCIAIRENEGRALMLGYNTFYFKLAALMLSSVTAAFAGTLYTLHEPVVTPDLASMGFTVSALLMVLIGGIGTLNGALVGAAVDRLLTYGLARYLGENASFISGAIYIAIVMFLPYGIVGTWNLKRFQRRQGWDRLLQMAGVKKK